MVTQSIDQPRLLQRPFSLFGLAFKWPIIPVLVFQSLVSLLTLHNTAFQDEALYVYAGRQLFDAMLGGPPVTEPYSTYFSGLPYLYPVLAGAADTLGGLELARAISLVSMLFVTWSVYYVGKHLFNRNSALLGAIVFSVQGSVLFLSRLATYDALCLALLSLGAVLAVRFASSKLFFLGFFLAPVLLLAFLTKYAGMLFIPSVFFLFFWQTLQLKGWKQAFIRTGISFVSLIGLAFLLLNILPSDVVAGLNSTTTNRTPLMSASGTDLAIRAATLGGGLFVLGLIGLIWIPKKQLLLAFALLGTALLAPAYHIYKGEATSLHKHVAFGLFFLAPLAGYALANLSGYTEHFKKLGKNWLLGLTICLVLFAIGFNQAKGLYGEWANSDNLVNVLKTQVRPGSGRILAEESEVPRYYLQNIVQFWQWSGLYWFEYTDKNGNYLTGEPAYKAALQEGYFDVVILRYGPTAALDYAIDGDLKDGKNYELIAQIPYYTGFGSGDYWIWRKKVA